MKFKVGDIVRGTSYEIEGKVGEVKEIKRMSSNENGTYGVSFKDFFGHDLSGNLPDSSGWYCNEDWIELMEEVEDI